MSTNSTEKLQTSTNQFADALTEQRKSPEGIVPTSEVLSVRSRAMAATLIKERFQKLPANLTADERDSKRAQLRQDSVRQVFKMLGILPTHDGAVEEDFSRNYRAVEESVADMDKAHLLDLADTYDGHAAIKVLDTVGATSSIARDDLVYMRRASLLLLEQYTDQQPS